jgi:ribonuclease-3
VAVRNPLDPHPIDRALTRAAPAGAAPADRVTDGAAPAGQVEQVLGHHFSQPRLLQEALTHRSASGKSRISNERLEFIGDRVLGLTIAVWLAERYPREPEGALGPRLAHLVSQPVLTRVAEELGLADLLSVAPGEARVGVRRRASVLADAVEALLGAMFLDGGLEPVERFVRRHFETVMSAETKPPKDPKTALQEWGQARGLGLPSYEVASQEGPSHNPRFVLRVTLGEASATGEAGTRRAAEQAGARDLLTRLSAS